MAVCHGSFSLDSCTMMEFAQWSLYDSMLQGHLDLYYCIFGRQQLLSQIINIYELGHFQIYLGLLTLLLASQEILPKGKEYIMDSLQYQSNLLYSQIYFITVCTDFLLVCQSLKWSPTPGPESKALQAKHGIHHRIIALLYIVPVCFFSPKWRKMCFFSYPL